MKVKVTCTNEFLVEVDEDESNAEYVVGLFLASKRQLSKNILRWNTHKYITERLTDEELEKNGWTAQWKE